MTDLNPTFKPGDRVRYATTGDDGFPLVRYGFVGGQTHDNGPVVVLLDGELGGDVVDLDKLEPVNICNVTLRLDGIDLLSDPTLRHGLMRLWEAEAEDAGLRIATIHPIDNGPSADGNSEGFALAELTAAGVEYELRASSCPTDTGAIVLHCDRAQRVLP